MFGKELFIRFTVRVFSERLTICVCASFPFGFGGGMWDLIVVVPDHCLSFTFLTHRCINTGNKQITEKTCDESDEDSTVSSNTIEIPEQKKTTS